MATVLRVDAPAGIRRFDARYRIDWHGGGVMALLLLIAGPIVMALTSGDLFGVVFSALWTATWAGLFVWWIVNTRRTNQWRVAVRIGAELILEAHRLYWKLSPDARGYALPLLNTMYRLSVIEVLGDTAQRRVRAEMSDRIAALRGLLDAEDGLRLVSADLSLRDRDDLDAIAAWRQALVEVEKRLSSDLL
jgi:hypothetical protein